jgi:hypothetical protein
METREWAIQKVNEIVDCLAAKIASKEGGLRVSGKQLTWDFVHQFPVAAVVGILEEKGLVLLRLPQLQYLPAHNTLSLCTPMISVQTMPPLHCFSHPLSSGSGYERRDPFVVSLLLTCS